MSNVRSPPRGSRSQGVEYNPLRGAAGLRSPQPNVGARSPPLQGGAGYDYVSQRMSTADPRRDSRFSAYSHASSVQQPEALGSPTLHSGNAHPYPVRQEAYSPAPSYGAISRTQSPGWSETSPTLNDWNSEGRRSRATTLNDPNASSIMLDKMAYADEGQNHALLDKEGRGNRITTQRKKPKRGYWTRCKICSLIILLLIAAAIGVGIGVWQATKGGSNSNKNSSSSGSAAQSGSPQSSPTTAAQTSAPTQASSTTNVVLWGGSGSTVPMTNGSTFVYNNTFGGTWCAVPFNDSARPQSFSPALDETWDWSADLMHGVNLGGWLVLEPFITPDLYQPFENDSTPAIDEWTLMNSLGTNASAIIENHYDTFITETDFAQIAAAGLNWIRLPLPYWAIETYQGEPFLEGVSWTYFLKALTWARKYGLRIELDLHTAPGSQNGLNHSGKLGTVNFLNGVMGIANADRTLNYVRTLTQFITQPQYKNVVQGFMVLNEPYLLTMGTVQLRSFYLQTYYMLRAIGGSGAGNGPMMFIHDGFVDKSQWYGFLKGADRVAMESHPYVAFTPANYDFSLQYTVTTPCSYWAAGYNASMSQFGFTSAGEWALAPNDCGEYVNGVKNGSKYDGTYNGGSSPSYGSCSTFTDYTQWSSQTKGYYHDLALAFMDMSRNWAFWTWKTNVSPVTGLVANPLWNYQLGLQQGWIPTDPRVSVGACISLPQKYGQSPVNTYSWASPLAATATGGSGISLNAASIASYTAWPVTSITQIGGVGNLPTYTPTASPVTLSASQPPASLFPAGDASTAVGNGWNDANDTAGWATPVAGCSYPNPWSGVGAAAPAAPCTGAGGARERRAPLAMPTATPVARS